jgi:hypothetical protein
MADGNLGRQSKDASSEEMSGDADDLEKHDFNGKKVKMETKDEDELLFE